jgi:hypothetical protein
VTDTLLYGIGIGCVIGFLFSILVLDKIYRESSKKMVDAIYEEYTKILKVFTNKIDTYGNKLRAYEEKLSYYENEEKENEGNDLSNRADIS